MNRRVDPNAGCGLIFFVFGSIFAVMGILGFGRGVVWRSGRFGTGAIVEHPFGPLIFGVILAIVGAWMAFRALKEPRDR